MSNKKRLRRKAFHRLSLPGASPGTLAHDPDAPRPIVRVMGYGPDRTREVAPDNLEFIRDFQGKWPVTWVNVDGLGDATVVSRLGAIFDLHRLSLEDVLNVHQRAKAEAYAQYYFIVARMVDVTDRFGTEQLSLFLGKNFVLTFQERAGDCFDPVRERIRKGGGRIRSSGPDYLAYAILDSLIDDYFPTLERYGERLDVLEEEVIAQPGKRTVAEIHAVRRDLIALRRAIWPLREAVNTLAREPTPLISAETRVYLRDCHDHAIQLIDLLENYREVAGSLMEVYLSSVSNRMNEIMKVLTIFTAVFIPLTLVSGIYGMNFNPEASRWNMPELNWIYGYPFALGLMAAVAGFMLYYFHRKGWISSAPPPGTSVEHKPKKDSGEN